MPRRRFGVVERLYDSSYGIHKKGEYSTTTITIPTAKATQGKEATIQTINY
jgi:hypothetical protein